MEQQKSGELFHFSFVVWQQLPAVTRRWGDRDAFTFELYSATGWTCIPPVTPDATNKLFVLKLTSMGLCVAQAENPSKSHPPHPPKKRLALQNSSWVQIGGVISWLDTQDQHVTCGTMGRYFPFFPHIGDIWKKNNSATALLTAALSCMQDTTEDGVRSLLAQLSGDGTLQWGHWRHLEASASKAGVVLLIHRCTLSITVNKYVEAAASRGAPCKVRTRPGAPDLDVSEVSLLISP